MSAQIAAQTARTLPDFEVVEYRDQNVSVNWEYATAYLTSERGSDMTIAYDDFRRELEADRKAFIVQACNAHDDLVAALRDLLNNPPVMPKGHGGLQYASRDEQAAHQRAVTNARAALAKAGAL